MGHQSPNPPQPAQWMTTTRIRSHPGSSQRRFSPTNCKCETTPLGPRPARVYPLASGQVSSLTSLRALRELKQQQQEGNESRTDLERPSWFKTSSCAPWAKMWLQEHLEGNSRRCVSVWLKWGMVNWKTEKQPVVFFSSLLELFLKHYP